jgi:hypothetical protein
MRSRDLNAGRTMVNLYLCARGDQQVHGVDFKETDLCTNPQGNRRTTTDGNSCYKWTSNYKTDTKQAYLNGDMGDDEVIVVHLWPPDWWQKLILDEYILFLVKSNYGTKQAAPKYHTHILGWMFRNDHLAVNSDKTDIKKTNGSDYIIHGLFVDYMINIASCGELRKEFMEKYSKYVEFREQFIESTHMASKLKEEACSWGWKWSERSSNQGVPWWLHPASTETVLKVHQEDAAPKEGADIA